MAAQKIGIQTKVATLSNNVQQLIAPSENTNGITLCTASIHLDASANGFITLNTGTVAPASAFSPYPSVLAARSSAAANLPYPLVIPAGQGLWVSSYAGGYAYISYEPVV